MLTGDPTQKLKHIGNDEVHIVWSENSKPYRRDLIATRFCDILIVLYPASPTLVRIQIETQDPSLQFGPMFDGTVSMLFCQFQYFLFRGMCTREPVSESGPGYSS